MRVPARKSGRETPDDGRDETEAERLDRNYGELLQELRVAQTGVQILFAFLLVVPFNSRFARLSGFERGLYMAALLCIAIATVLIITPSIHHRILFRHGQKAFLVEVGNRLLIIAALFLAAGLGLIMLLIGEVVIGEAGAIAIGAAALGLTAGLWFVLPLSRRRRLNREAGTPGGGPPA